MGGSEIDVESALAPILEEELLPPGTRHFVVVYQYGKVASTSLVSSLSRMEGVVATQTHFLGQDSFAEMVGLLVDPKTSDFFFEQGLSQFVTNLRLERAIGAVRARKYPGMRLNVLSLVREPLDWFRSSLAQDIDGYIEALRGVEQVGSEVVGDDEAAIVAALPKVCERIADALEASGGIDAFRALKKGSPERDQVLRDNYGPYRSALIHPFFFLFLRPYVWFASHYSRYLGVDVSRLDTIAPHLYRGEIGPGARTYVIRYEDLGHSMPLMLADMGIHQPFELVRENVTGSTGLAAAVRAGLASSPLDRLRALSNASEYAQQFGYVI